ncbi:V/A-type H+-transporting ATPase subunit I [Mobilisporobacter senegalensis]|uniref:V/A-type H+-transporting ATPase subunit I n=1 Tax=Mobilisporobacter senegalensis TaxID=1329262 RepID=A0A3N1XLV0_9FIRM|nr:V-type ATP synthase subunit I [Mobilisporobacter senegalensis]ROR25697.1 V/A-type H+-transporting ATPase subunit I [Mobilisporobacter senegalensis]
MAVLQMQRISICALKKNRKQILELLQRLGVVEVNDVIPEDSLFKKSDVTKGRTLLDKNVNRANDALGILDTYAKEDTSMLSVLNGRTEVSTTLYNEFYDKHDEVLRVINQIISLERSIAENKAKVINLQLQMEALKPWMNLDIPIDLKGTKSTNVFIGALPNEWTLDTVYEELATYMPMHIDIISTSREQTCVLIVCLKEKSDEVLEGLRKIGFAKPSSAGKEPPVKQQEELENQLNLVKQEIENAKETISSLASRREDIQFFTDYDSMRTEKYDVISNLVQSKNVFVLTGYIAQKDAPLVEKAFGDNFDVAIEFESVDEDDNVPVVLKNNSFSAPLEGVVEAFSPPGKGEIDPTMIMSLFYYMLFGLMLSDAAYGVIMVLGCGILLLKYKKMEENTKNSLKMFLYCGISTIFWGVMFGSYFGDVVDVVSQTFFGVHKTIPALWFYPVNEPMRMLTFSMVVGVIHLFAGLGMKLHQSFKLKQYKDAFYDVVSWYLLLISSILVLLSTQLFVDILGIGFTLPPVVGKISGVLAVVASIIIILTNGRESRNPFKRFLKGLYALYGITGYLSDVLSYSRLLALGLATGVICTVINKMGSMAGGGITGAILFTIVFIFGHTLNIGINALGAYVHTNRLQYVEFFGKFFEGGGRKFNPFNVKTKYYKFKEKTYDE